MSRLSVTLEVDSPEQEQLLRQYHAFLQEMEALALTAPEGQVLDVCETAVLQTRQVVSCLGALRLRRRWWGSRCGCEGPGYAADALLGLDSRYTRRLQEHLS